MRYAAFGLVCLALMYCSSNVSINRLFKSPSQRATSLSMSGVKAEPSLFARVVREHRDVRSDGVTVATHYQESLFRNGDQVWMERVMPENLAQDSDSAHRHAHPNWSTAARHLSKLADGGVALELVLLHSSERVGIPPAERDAVGFTASWDEAAHLLPAYILSNMKEIENRPNQAGTRWLEHSNAEGTLRALWSDELHIALKVESSRADGTWQQTLELEIQPLPQVWPWQAVNGFTPRSIDDYRD